MPIAPSTPEGTAASPAEPRAPSALSSEGAPSGALLPRSVRHWLWATLAVLLAAACYLVSVRGTAILFDLRDAVSAMCF